jgi:hypothetical protein
MLRRIPIATCVALALLAALAVAVPAVGSTLPALRRTALPPAPTVPPFVGASVGGFALEQSAPGAIAEVPDPAGSGEAVFKLTVSDTDVYPLTPTHDPRAELLSPANIEPGDQFWWSAKFLLPTSFPASVPGWLTVLEGPYGPPFDGTPSWHLEVNRDHIQWSRNRTYSWDVPWRMPLVRGRWVEVMTHTRLGAHGFVEMWVDGRRVVFFSGGGYNPSRHAPTRRLAMQTLDSSNDAGPNYVSMLNYRRHDMFPSATVYQGPLAVGPTRASVTPASAAFGRG